MYSELMKYDLGAGVEVFSTQRNASLPYPVIQGHQVHDCKVAVVDRPDMTREDLEGYDAFVTNLPGVAIGVRTADCIPVLLYDPVRRVIAAVHAGWKGTALHISRKAIGVMSHAYFRKAGFPIDEIWCFNGPGDGTPMSGGHHIDLWKANRWLLEQEGIPKEAIHLAGIDTYSTEAFFSARREGIHCGRIINAIKLIPQ